MNLGGFDFNGYDKDWNEDEDGIKDGDYTAKIDRVEWRCSKSGVPYLSYGLKLSDGRMVWKVSSLKTSKTRGMLKRELKIILDQSFESPGQVDLESMLDKEVDIAVQTNGDNTNVYIRSLAAPF